MISVYQLKPKFQQLLLPVLNLLHQCQMTANKITIAAMIWSAALGLLLFMSPNHPIYLVVVAFGLLVRMALNALDGMMARIYAQQSKLGEILNEMGDVISDSIIFCGLFSQPQVNQSFVWLFVVLSIISEFSGVLSKVISGTRRYDGPMGKSDRALVIGLWCVMVFLLPSMITLLNATLIIGSVLMVMSSYKRLSNSLK